MRSWAPYLPLLAVLALAGCAGGAEPAGPASTPSVSPSPSAGAGCDPAGLLAPPDGEPGEPSEPALRAELLEMMEADQAERTGEVAANNDASRTGRLREIIDRHGWPTHAMVGVDGGTAAWVIAQHSDQDVPFQREALGLMCEAAVAGEVDLTELAYLVDRVAVNSGEPQVYGTQVGSCENGRAVPRPLADERRVDALRAQVGLEPLAEYLAQFDEGCREGTG